MPSQKPVIASPAVVIEPGVTPEGRKDPQGDAQQGGGADRYQGELDRRREAFQDVVEHRTPRVDAQTQIAGSRLPQIDSELHIQGSIEAIALPQGFDLFPNGPFASNERDGITGTTRARKKVRMTNPTRVGSMVSRRCPR
jgi:hypothetical protein